MKRFACLLAAAVAFAVNTTLAAEPARVKIDDQGVLRWMADNSEVALFGANYSLPSGSEYRAAGQVGADRKKLVEQDLAHFARMGWDGLRLCFWGDWENSDREGNLVVNAHLDVLDYAIAEAHRRGISILFTPITTYSSAWPDGNPDTLTGFSRYFPRGKLCIDPAAVAASCNYLRQILEHVNPYTGVALKDEPAILFIEMINEPVHDSADVAGTTAYLRAIAEAVRSTGCRKPLFHNISQDFGILPAIKAAPIDGLTFAWYPTGLNSGRMLTDNHLRATDAFTPMLRTDLRRWPKLVYEFDSADMLAGYMYPAMVRAFREAGAQFAAMFTYDMVATAPYNLAWQTHYLNLVYTPRKAASAIIAGEAMRRLPLYHGYGAYPTNCRFGPFRVSYDEDLSEMLTDDAFLYANDTATAPGRPELLHRIVGCGSSPVVGYEGNGVYFLDRLAERTWRLEVYPDAVSVRDPFAQLGNAHALVSRLVSREWPMTVRLPGLGSAFSVQPLNGGNTHAATANGGRFLIRPGVYLLSSDPALDRGALPARVGGVGLTEFVCPDAPTLPTQVVRTSPAVMVADQPFVFSVNVITATAPREVTLALRTSGKSEVREMPLRPAGGYSYRVEMPANTFTPGSLECSLVVRERETSRRFPENSAASWPIEIVAPNTPLPLFSATDVSRCSFSRIGDGIRKGVYQMEPATENEPAAMRLFFPLSKDRALDDYTASLDVTAQIRARSIPIERAAKIRVVARGSHDGETVHLTLVEVDGTAWSVPVRLNEGWQTVSIALDQMLRGRGVMLPLGFPGRWNYWSTPAEGRGGHGDRLRLTQIQCLQLSFRPPNEVRSGTSDEWADFASVSLEF